MRGLFVVGTGRSGTHFTLRLLRGFAGTRDPLEGREDHGVLMDVARAAIRHRLPPGRTANRYRALLADPGGVLLDQHHPNLFFARHWAELFEGIVFVYPSRPTHQIVASMLRHEGVMGWYRYARDWRRVLDPVPFPNRFLGLERRSEIASLPPHILCARRVIAHRRAFEAARAALGDAVRAVDYEALVRDPEAELARVFTAAERARLGAFERLERPDPASLTKYRDVLSEGEVAEIAALEAASRLRDQPP